MQCQILLVIHNWIQGNLEGESGHLSGTPAIDIACFSSQLKYFEHYYVCICLASQWLKVKVNNIMGDFFVWKNDVFLP